MICMRLKLAFLCVISVSISLSAIGQSQTNDLFSTGHKVIQLSDQLRQSWGEGKQYLQILNFAFQPFDFAFTDSISISIFDGTHRPVVNRERMLDDGMLWDLMPMDSVFGFINRADRVFTREIEMRILYPDSMGILLRIHSPVYFGGPPIPFLEYPVNGTAVTTQQVKFQWTAVVNNVDAGGVIIWDIEPALENISDHVIYRQEVDVASGSQTIDLDEIHLRHEKTYYWALWYFRDLLFYDDSWHFPGFSIELNSFSVGSEDVTRSPIEFRLLESYPNPFNRQTIISWYQSHSGLVQLRVYNILGQLIKELSDDITEVGIHQKRWNGTNEQGNRVQSGLYFIVGESLNQHFSTKVMLLN